MKRTLILVIALAGLIAGLHYWRAATTEPLVLAAAPGSDPRERERLIGVFERRVESDPDPLNLSVLGDLYLDRARAENDLTGYQQARDTLILASSTVEDPGTLINLATSHLALHEFGLAREIAGRVAAEEPSDAALATLVDAQLALGEYTDAAANLNVLGQRLPDEPAVLARQAQYYFLTGSIEEARQTSALAAEIATEAGLSRADQAFFLMVAGRMDFEGGQYRSAEGHLRRAIEIDDSAPGPLVELGRVLLARRHADEAITTLEKAAALVPEPLTLAWLADAYQTTGAVESAEDQHATINAIARLAQPAYRLSIASILAVSGRDPHRALELAQEELSIRSDPTTWHVYAMALLSNGATEEAYEAIQRALGPADARLQYHAGMIAAAAGRETEAITHLEGALMLNPSFHPQDAPAARALLEALTK
jgi:tetratricopeptide (TPR) repeat protein